MPRSAVPASRLLTTLGGLGLAALALVTLVHPGATRMHAWPWTLAYAAALLAPPLLLAWRALDRTRPLVLPAGPWSFGALAAAAGILLSAALSPYRGASLWWSLPLLSALAAFFAFFDLLHGDAEAVPARRVAALQAAGLFFAAVILASVGGWARHLPDYPLRELFDFRNGYPLGHSNYTAGATLLALPCFAALAYRNRGRERAGWIVMVALSALALFVSGSRGGMLGLAALGLGALLGSGLSRPAKLGFTAVALAAALLFALANPRIRSVVFPSPGARPNLSNVQRAAMLQGGIELGRERPWLGWGPGTIPLAFPRVRAQTVGGVENVLQLHSLPAQLWAELGAAGVAGFVGFVLLVLGAARREPLVAAVAGGYLVFAFTDYQLDVPLFAVSLALLAALLAAPAPPSGGIARGALRLLFAAAGAVALIGARPDPTPGLNVRALALAADPNRRAEAVELFNRSLTLNPDQEIAHFNLGWLQVVSAPAAAEEHFLAVARLVPDKGGVYFGLGLARLNQGRRDLATQAFALECINDPIFLVSPWWCDPAVAALRPGTLAQARGVLDALAEQKSAGGREAAYLSALMLWIEGRATAAVVEGVANTDERSAYFAATPEPVPAVFAGAPVLAYRRSRVGYPVLMRNLDLPEPTDLFDVQENSLATGKLRFLFPAKGWLF